MIKLIKMIVGIAICAVVGGVLTYIGIPLALMFGPIIAIIIFNRLGFSFSIPKHTITFVQVTLGSSVGLITRNNCVQCHATKRAMESR